MVTLYTIDCPRCKVLEKKLEKANIEYQVCKDMDFMISKGIKTMPVLEVEDSVLDFKAAVDWVNERS